MKVKYLISFNINNEDIKFEYSTGEIAGFITEDKDNPDRFLVVDNNSGAFLKVKVCECFKID